ncbi:MAG: threonine/serine exporter family protein [Clostridioides sp.]|nr:threonine/serine exporter family protein [Clostridioides sp.]
MDRDYIQDRKKDVLKIALFVGELMLKNGAETSRIEDSLLRICRSRGFDHVNVFTTPTVIIISDEKFDGLSFMKTITSRGINLDRISALNDFSRDYVNNKYYDNQKAVDRLYSIQNSATYPKPVYYIATGLGSAFFACLLGGNQLVNFALTLIISILATIVYDNIIKVSSIAVFACLTSSLFIGTLGVLLAHFKILADPMMLIVGGIMPLLPGVAFIKALRDLISGDIISGVARAFEVIMIVVSIAAGVGFVLNVWYQFGGLL